MGIYNRDYIRNDGGGYRDRGGWSFNFHWTPVVKALVIINLGVWLLQILITTGPEIPADAEVAEEMIRFMPRTSLVQKWFQLETEKVMHGQVWRIVTAAFCHDRLGVLHILFNMLFLVWFGRRLEEKYGSREFLGFYLVAAVFSSMAFIGLDLYTGSKGAMLGASGAVMGVVMLYAIHFPRERIYIWLLFPVEIRWIVMIYIVFDLHPVLLALSGDSLSTGVAHAAHLGGLAFGLLYWKFNWKLEKYVPESRQQRAQVREVKKTRRMEKRSREDEDEVDRILDKMSREGIHSLTAQEKKFLERTSRDYKNR